MKKLLLSFLLFAGTIQAQIGPPPIPTYRICEENTDGFATFDLPSYTAQLWDGMFDEFDYDYFLTQDDAVANINPLSDMFINTTQGGQWLFARQTYVSDPTVFYTRQFLLQVRDKPIAAPIPDLTIYQDEATHYFLRFYEHLPLITNNQNVDVYYYSSLANAESNTNPITYCNYGTFTLPTVVWVRLANDEGCFAISSFNLQVSPGNNPSPSPAIAFTDFALQARLLMADIDSGIVINECGQNAKLDVNNDYEIQVNEAKLAAELNLQGTGVNSAGGLEYFTNLSVLNFQDNDITTIDFSPFKKLTTVSCTSNLLTELDFSQNKRFQYLDCAYNQLTFINLKNGSTQDYPAPADYPFWNGNPDLHYICADSWEVPYIQLTLDYNNITGVNINDYCEFGPGGEHNTISGTITLDNNSDGCDPLDVFQPNIKLKLTQGATVGYSFLDNNGQYLFDTMAGDYTISPEIENASYFSVTPASAIVSFDDIDSNIAIENFCVTPIGIHNDVEIAVPQIIRPRPGFDAVYKIIYKNKGNQVLSGNVAFTYNEAVLDYVSSSLTPDATAAGVLTWNYINLLPFESRSVIVTLNVNGPMETPPVNIGDYLDFTVEVTPEDEIADNTFSMHQVVIGSFDPNDKVCLQGESVAPSEIGRYLHYTINFENTGNAAAENIVVKDIIDTTKFDLSTLEIIDNSHPMVTMVAGNRVEFFFQNINLGANQHGNVTFKIKTLPSLTTGTTVTNQADIFFDYNFPVITNIASTTFETLGTQDFDIDNSVTIAPNPVTDFVVIKAAGIIKAIQLFDIQGRMLLTEFVASDQIVLNIAAFTNGIYLMKVNTDTGIKTERIIKK